MNKTSLTNVVENVSSSSSSSSSSSIITKQQCSKGIENFYSIALILLILLLY